jgi:hypothetical protein
MDGKCNPDGRISHLAFLMVALVVLLAACEGNPVEVVPDRPASGDTTILFIGNSITSYYGLPDQFEALADSQGREVWVWQSIRTGVNLTQYLEYANLDAGIAAQEWDWVILQDSSPYIAFPEYHSYYYATYIELKERITRESPAARIVMFMLYALDTESVQDTTWAYADFQPLLREGTIAIADSLGFVIAPVGWAFRQVRQEYPELPLYYLDGIHPSKEAQYLQACVYYTSIFGESPEGSPFTAGLSDSTAARLQRIAAEVVLNEAGTWNLPPGRRRP